MNILYSTLFCFSISFHLSLFNPYNFLAIYLIHSIFFFVGTGFVILALQALSQTFKRDLYIFNALFYVCAFAFVGCLLSFILCSLLLCFTFLYLHFRYFPIQYILFSSVLYQIWNAKNERDGAWWERRGGGE